MMSPDFSSEDRYYPEKKTELTNKEKVDKRDTIEFAKAPARDWSPRDANELRKKVDAARKRESFRLLKMSVKQFKRYLTQTAYLDPSLQDLFYFHHLVTRKKIKLVLQQPMLEPMTLRDILRQRNMSEAQFKHILSREEVTVDILLEAISKHDLASYHLNLILKHPKWGSLAEVHHCIVRDAILEPSTFHLIKKGKFFDTHLVNGLFSNQDLSVGTLYALLEVEGLSLEQYALIRDHSWSTPPIKAKARKEMKKLEKKLLPKENF